MIFINFQRDYYKLLSTWFIDFWIVNKR